MRGMQEDEAEVCVIRLGLEAGDGGGHVKNLGPPAHWHSLQQVLVWM